MDVLPAARGGAGRREHHPLSARPTAPAHAHGRRGALPAPKFGAKEMAMSALTFADRTEAGQALALPRGGVPVAYEVARTLALPMDVFVCARSAIPSTPNTPWAPSPAAVCGP